MSEWQKVGIVGVGLIGGSFALALREAGFKGKMIGVSSPRTVEAALARGVIDEALPLADAAALCNLLYLSQPIEKILETIDAIDESVRPGTLITDAGSTKQAIVERASAKIQRGRFVGGHPMAGKEARGVEAAEAGLFRGRPYVLTAPDPELESWIQKIGARLVYLDPAEHDRLVALVSHLPQLVSTALASTIADDPDAAAIAGPAAADLTRLALSPYDIWRDIFSTNRDAVDLALEMFITRLEILRAQLQEGSDLEQEFEKAARTASGLRR